MNGILKQIEICDVLSVQRVKYLLIRFESRDVKSVDINSDKPIQQTIESNKKSWYQLLKQYCSVLEIIYYYVVTEKLVLHH